MIHFKYDSQKDRFEFISTIKFENEIDFVVNILNDYLLLVHLNESIEKKFVIKKIEDNNKVMYQLIYLKSNLSFKY